jgi:hypothetical protein
LNILGDAESSKSAEKLRQERRRFRRIFAHAKLRQSLANGDPSLRPHKKHCSLTPQHFVPLTFHFFAAFYTPFISFIPSFFYTK